MPGTFSQIYIQTVFAVRGRQSLIHQSWENHLYKYITGIVQSKKQKMIAINGMPDHIHILIGMKPTCCLSDLVREIKKSSNDYINYNQFCRSKFIWQEGYGAFSYSQTSLQDIINYVHNQKEHHKKQSFKDEYLSLLSHYNIDYKSEYLFEWN